MDAPRISSVRLLAALLACASILPPSVRGQVAGSDSLTTDTSNVAWRAFLPPVTVTATRIPTSPAHGPAPVTILDSADIHGGGASSVATVLEDQAGLHVRRYGAGGLATPMLRGTGASQTVLLLDGQRINDPQIGHLDLSILPSVLLESVTVMRGPASSLHGSDGLGGAIHLRSVRPRRPLQARVSTQVGAFGQRGGSLLLGGAPTGATSLLIAADRRSTDGDFRYVDTGRFPPKTVRRQNADRTRSTLYGSLRSRVGAHRLRISGWLTQSERGLPSAGAGGGTEERQRDRQVRLWGRDRVPLNAGTLTVRGLAQHTRLRYANPARGIDQTGRTGLASLEATVRHPLGGRWTAAGGLSGGIARARHPMLRTEAHQQNLSLYGEATGRYGRITFFPALRTDAYWMPRGNQQTAISPRIGVNLQPLSHRPDLRLKAQVGRSFRVPTFNDRYWQPGGTPNLRPEHSWGGDVGIRFDQSVGHLELTAFGHWRRDQIVWQPTGEGYWSPTNVGRVRAFGTELSAGARWTLAPDASITADLTYTLTDARNRTDPDASSFGEPVLYVPRTLTKAQWTLSWGPASLSATARDTGRRPITSDGSRFRDGFTILDTQLRLDHEVGAVRTALTIRLENTLDTDHRSVGGRPMPPRHLQVRLLLTP